MGAALALLSASFLRMPPLAPPLAPPIALPEGAGAGAGMGAGAGASALGLRAQLRHIARRRAPLQIATLGLLVGLSLVLQGMLPFVLAGVRSCAHTPCSPATLAPNPRPRTSQSTPQP